jgi:uncharacterized membrane protein YesL
MRGILYFGVMVGLEQLETVNVKQVRIQTECAPSVKVFLYQYQRVYHSLNMIFLIVENLLLTTNIEELRENSDRPTTTKDGEYCTGSTLCLNPYLLHIN